jgi:hypothetical protein
MILENHEEEDKSFHKTLDNKISVDLAVECWNLRNTLQEANESNNFAKKDIKMEKYLLRRVQDESLQLKRHQDKLHLSFQDKCKELDILTKKMDSFAGSRRCIIANYAKSEHFHKALLKNYSQLEIDNTTMIEQM